MITVKRTDYEAKTFRNKRTGRTRLVPSHYECRYIYDGKEIAFYESRDDVLYLKTDYIGSDFKRSEYDRALTSKYSEAYSYLFQMLNCDSTTRMSEYTNL